MSDTDNEARLERAPACAPVLLFNDRAPGKADGPELAREDAGHSIAVAPAYPAAVITA